MTTTLTRPIWEAICDRVYACRVERGDNGTGRLTVSYVGNVGRPLVVHRQDVGLEYGHLVGADNIAEWQAICADVIHYPELRNPSQ